MKLSNLASVLRNAGLTVVETAGWANRGYAGQDLQAVAGVLWHHTATNRSRFNEDAPTLSMCVNGRSDLAGCNSESARRRHYRNRAKRRERFMLARDA